MAWHPNPYPKCYLMHCTHSPKRKELFFPEMLKIIMSWKGSEAPRLMGCAGRVAWREMPFDTAWRIWAPKAWQCISLWYRTFPKFLSCEKKKNLSLTMKYIFTNFLGHPWQTKLRTVTGTNKWTLDSHLKITQNRNNLPRITQTTITWNLNTATKTRLKNTTNNRRRVAGKLYNFRGNKTELMY